jgi:hypothetical protein
VKPNIIVNVIRAKETLLALLCQMGSRLQLICPVLSFLMFQFCGAERIVINNLNNCFISTGIISRKKQATYIPSLHASKTAYLQDRCFSLHKLTCEMHANILLSPER